MTVLVTILLEYTYPSERAHTHQLVVWRAKIAFSFEQCVGLEAMVPV